MGKLLILFIVLFSFNFSFSQVFDNKSISSLTILEGDTITFLSDSLVVDTLIMRNRSTLRLTQDTYILIKKAFIANGCRIDNSGIDGSEGVKGNMVEVNGSNGFDGSSGKNVFLIINFLKLGSLEIDTHGGNGGMGGKGLSPLQNRVYGEKGFTGGNGGLGGAGANAGNISLYYLSNQFIPRLNRKDGYHSISFLIQGGTCGKGGMPGRGGQGGASHVLRDPLTQKVVSYTPKGKSGADGIYSDVCYSGNDGQVFFKRLTNE